MIDEMGSFRTDVNVENPLQPGVFRAVTKAMVDTGSEYTFKVECTGGRIPVHGSGHINYTAQTMKGVIDLIAEQPSLRITTHSSVSARRLGPCNS